MLNFITFCLSSVQLFINSVTDYCAITVSLVKINTQSCILYYITLRPIALHNTNVVCLKTWIFQVFVVNVSITES
jgi:hypothetical protein